MKPTYEIKYSGKVLESKNLEDLKRIVKNTEAYWEIWAVYRPGDGQEKKIDDLNVIKALKMIDEGYSQTEVAKIFNVSQWYIHKIILKNKQSNSVT